MIIRSLTLWFLNILFFITIANAQWVSNPSSNTKLVIGTENPVNLSAVEDGNGGVFVVWEDVKSGLHKDVFFIHANNRGEISLRADGKTVSTIHGKKEVPLLIVDEEGFAYVIWKGSINQTSDHLFVQRLSKNGNRMWGNEGLNISNNQLDIVDYEIDYNRNGSICAAYILREPGFTGDYIIAYQSLDKSGKLLKPGSDETFVFRSNNRKSKISIVSDISGGAFIFWLENVSGRGVLRACFVDETGKLKWSKEPVNISSTLNNVLTYNANSFGNSVYLSFQYQGQRKSIHHQLITRNGNLPWGLTSKTVTSLRGSQINPQTAILDSSIYISWTNELNNDKDIYVQKFDKNGKALWKKDGLPVIRLDGDQFGQKIISDGKDNIILAWIDKRVDSVYGNIYAQKLDNNGNFLWDSLSVVLGAFHNTQKSYLNLVPDGKAGAIAVFRENREGRNEIFAQKIFSTGTYASQVLGFNAHIENEKIKLSWYAANESPKVSYEIHRTTQADTNLTQWDIVGTIDADFNKAANFYEIYDVPNSSGTIYYRLVQKDEGESATDYEIVRVNYFENASKIILAQNSPNPFSDETVIGFYLPEETDVAIEFFDSKVEVIKEIPKQKYTAGNHEIIFDGKNLEPGIYYYRFKAGSHIEVKKMVIAPK